MLPSSNCREYLIARYFTYQAPLFHVLHGPSFQKQYADFIQESVPISLPWLALLFAVCSSAFQTLDAGDPILKDYWSTSPDILERDPTILSRHLRGVALICLSEARFMVHYNLHTLEALLIMIYGICHSEGVDRGWIFLGIALNMGIALRCNTDSQDLNCIEKQRRRRCWAGILMLHTYQGILFRDIDMSFLLTIPSIMPADVNDADINEDRILEPSVRPTSMSLMHFKTRLFNLSTRICSRLSNSLPLDETTMKQYDGLIASEQQQWDSTYLPGGSPNLLDTASYAYWCILQTYAHQLYLLIHRPFYHSQSSQYLPSSREKYLQSSMSLIDLHQQIDELPILRPYRWLVNGMTSFNALQGAVALAGCLVDTSDESDTLAPHRETFDSAVHRIKSLQKSSPVCARAYQALENLQTQLARSNDNSHESLPQDWDINSGWLDLNAIDYDWWDNLINNINGDIPGDGTGVY